MTGKVDMQSVGKDELEVQAAPAAPLALIKMGFGRNESTYLRIETAHPSHYSLVSTAEGKVPALD